MPSFDNLKPNQEIAEVNKFAASLLNASKIKMDKSPEPISQRSNLLLKEHQKVNSISQSDKPKFKLPSILRASQN